MMVIPLVALSGQVLVLELELEPVQPQKLYKDVISINIQLYITVKLINNIVYMSEENSNNTPLPDTLAPPATETQVQQQAPKPEPKYKERVIEMVGLESCGFCKDAEQYINNDVKPQSDVPITFRKIDAHSEEGQRIVKEKKLKYVPHIKECLIPTDPTKTPDCKETNNFSKKDIKVKVNE